MSSTNWRVAAGVVSLLIILSLQLLLSVRQESQTWDEANHIYAGYKSWTSADFGLNPEHPPLVKLVATAPLLSAPPKTPALALPANVVPHSRAAIKEAVKRVMADPGFDRVPA